ncbi:MAG TPA: HD domain-containing phosphohydrolase [Thermoleophilia bacterium]|nr:HD domain-containing phosphohydrolase [Thermoleophilia bacterium]HQG03926.1 HD domain-containing phosphohydrolase [Thermoleophilia bacterium]HQJ97653.1 HD domain-containing phosphohydrolase [Thermoleophilia bacterium]
MSTPLHVLIVDDSEDDSLLLRRALKRGGYEVTSERVDTSEAMQAALAAWNWDVVLCDYAMPRFDPFAALDVLHKSGNDLPFIVVSGAMAEESAVAVMKAGAHDCIMKRNLARLVPAIQRELAEAETRRARKQAERRLEESFVALAETVSKATAARDPYTAAHERDVAQLAKLVGQRLGLDDERLMGLYIGGLLHDVGKVSVPESLLSRPGALTPEEWALIRTHTGRGSQILGEAELPWPVAEMALHHHERPDGSGYPDGLRGDELGLEVRIIAVCDVVSAMSAHRPYRPAKSMDVVTAELRNGRGTKYDEQVVDVMLEILAAGEFRPEQA